MCLVVCYMLRVIDIMTFTFIAVVSLIGFKKVFCIHTVHKQQR